jgi:hypothetical protein
MIITVKGADFAGAGLGFTNWVKQFISETGVTDTAQKTALLQLDASIESAGLWPYIFGIIPFCGSSALSQRWVFKKDAVTYGTFQGSGSSAAGFQGGQGNSLKIPFVYPNTSPSGFSMGVYNKSSESYPSIDQNRFLMDFNNVNNGFTPSHKIILSRRYFVGSGNYTTFGQCGSTNTGGYCFPSTGTYDNNKTGFLQIVKNASNLYLIDQGSTIKTAASSETLSNGGGTNGIIIGGGFGPTPSNFSTALITFAYWGKLNETQAITFNTIVNNFLTSIGRN